MTAANTNRIDFIGPDSCHIQTRWRSQLIKSKISVGAKTCGTMSDDRAFQNYLSIIRLAIRISKSAVAHPDVVESFSKQDRSAKGLPLL
jgi:hypothetical protein